MKLLYIFGVLFMAAALTIGMPAGEGKREAGEKELTGCFINDLDLVYTATCNFYHEQLENLS